MATESPGDGASPPRDVWTHHLLHQVLHDEALLLRADVGHPQPAVIQFIVNDKHVPFQEAWDAWGEEKKSH